jgi:hypothetical protein
MSATFYSRFVANMEILLESEITASCNTFSYSSRPSEEGILLL